MVKVISAREMFEASCAAFERCDAAIMAAAVCDFRPKMQSAEKMEKKGHSLILELDLTEDICACLGRNKGRRVVVGFAMEDHDHHRSAERKLRQKRCDAIVLNPVSTAGGDSGEIEVFSPETGWQPPVHGTKAELAEVVVTLTEQLTRSGGAGDGQAPDG